MQNLLNRLDERNGNDEKNLSENDLLFISVSVGKSLLGKFSYGHKLRSSRSKKLVIKDLVLYTDQKISASKKLLLIIRSEKMLNNNFEVLNESEIRGKILQGRVLLE